MKKLKRLVLGIMITIVLTIVIAITNIVNAQTAGPLYLGIVMLRSSGYSYQLGRDGENGLVRIFKIAQYPSADGGTADKSKTIYCIKAGPGFGSADAGSMTGIGIRPYTQKFDFKDVDSIESPYSNAIPQGTNYNKVLWILDNLYIIPSPEEDNTEERNKFLEDKIPDEIYELLTDDDIDVIQQLAIWHFTNEGDSKYSKNEIELYINSIAGVDADHQPLEDLYEEDGWDRQDAANALFQYYINNAPEDYVSTNYTTKPVEIKSSSATMQIVENNYVAGPYTIEQLIDNNYDLSVKYTDTVTGSEINPTLSIKDENGDIVTTNKTLKELIGTEFYLVMPVSSNINGIKMTVSTSYTSRTLTYWSVENAPATDQPVVIVEETPYNFSEETSIVVPKPFDLSLRKFITEVNGIELIDSDTGKYLREPIVDTSALKAGTSTTATYTHPKNPVAVDIGDIVTYTIRVYNEGSTDGYVEEITDHLPDQLQFIIDDELNIEYGWKLASSSDLHTVKTDYLSKAKETSTDSNKIEAYDGGETLDYKEVKIRCKVVSTEPMANKITNIADITKFTDGDGNTATDRDSQEDNVEVPTGTELEEYKDDEIKRGETYIPGQQDDDDFEKLILKEFDLSLRKFITNINGEEITSRIPQVDTTPLKNGTSTTATYNHPKDPIKIDIGDIIIYTIRVYNEGEVDGYVEEVTDHLPAQLEFLPDNEINKQYGWVVDENNSRIIRTDYLSKDKETDEGENKILAYDGGDELDYRDVKVACKVVYTEPMPSKITNIAEISEFTNGNGDVVTDRDSQEDNADIPSDDKLPEYKDDEISKDYVPGQQDDDDFEKVMLKEFDLALRKFITNVDGEEITSRIPQVDVTDLAAGTSTTATYNHSKEPVEVKIGETVVYTIRVYNEGEVDGYAEEITDHLPEQLEFLPDNEINKQYGWVMKDANGNETEDVSKAVEISTDYLSKKNETTTGENLIKAFDGTTLSYKDVKVACKVILTDPMPDKITNIADITDYTDDNGEKVPDRDSEEDNVEIPDDLPGYKDDEISKDYVPGQEDDDDFEKVIIKEFDLALRKFITAVNDTEITSRIPQVDVTELAAGTSTTAKYEHSKEPVLVSNGNIVTYTIRVYNEGEADGYAKTIKDDIPEGLEYLPENETNINYMWVMLDEEGNETEDVSKAVSIATDYLSKENEKVPGENLIKAFDGKTLSYKDVKVAFKVIEPNTSDRIIINEAQIAEDTDKDGDDVDDRDSTPDEWIEGEDDQDIEKVKVQFFDLALRKWVTQAIVIEDGKETITETGHKAEDDPEAIVKVDLKDSKIDKVTVKFRYSIRVTNEGKIAGYVKEIKDYIPDGLKFVQEDNPKWQQLDDQTIVTDQTKDILLKPGESTEVEVVLTWINSDDNLKVMDNWAEISKDYNDYHSPDVDSTPDNREPKEDDIDDAPVLITVKTGQAQVYIVITFAVLAILGTGVILIRKFVL